ncbi:MAG TPA: ABC transporter substrate-binding protein [Stellaceae bacterium]|nr:ABC transporter substrate-binding protein [Stellaceae bacterium]
MNRRAFIAGVTVTAAIGRAWAQQRVYRLAVVSPSARAAEMSETGSREYNAFFRRLRDLGYVEGQNLAIARYSGEGKTEDFAELARAVVRRNPDLIFVAMYRLAHAFEEATGTIPMVGIGGDPVAFGVTSSLARPDRNVTGVTGDTGARESKSLALLLEMVPGVSRVAFLASPGIWESPYVPALREGAERLKVSIIGPPLDAPFDEAEYRRVFAAMARAGANALMVSGQVENLTNQRLIVDLADKYRLPAIYFSRASTEIGGLMAYGPDILDMWRHAADQVDQIFKGAKPADIPFYQPTKFELTVNGKTAKALGLTVPQSILGLADEVIE